jgi:3beta-hydroxy-Delta5-steroid dehydrogenase / steroid Delta-isomerase
MTKTALPIVPDAPQFSADELGPRCLVTGGAGYVGSAIVRRLRAAGCAVRSFDVVDHKSEPGVEVVTGDLRDYNSLLSACKGIDTVFHTAALIKLMAIARPSLRRLVFDVNVGGTTNVTRSAAAAGVTALVHTSTFNVVMDRDYVRQDETLPYAVNTNDLYTRSKIEAERVALAADAPGGLRVCALRPGGIWGIDTTSIMVRSFLEQLDNFTVLIGDGHSAADNTHIDNLVDAQLLAARALRSKPDVAGGQAYFITDDEPLNPLEWFRPLVEGLGRSFPTRRLPAGMMRIVGVMLEVTHWLGAAEPVLTRRSVRNLTESGSFCIDKARRDLGYAPRYCRDNGMPRLLPIARAYLESRKQSAA